MRDEVPRIPTRPKRLTPVDVELVQDLSEIAPPLSGFLRRHRHRVKTVMEDGHRTDTYVVDFADRQAEQRDAVAIVVYARDGTDPGATRILLRRQVRYAAYLVTGQSTTIELIAGLIEGEEPHQETGHRELWEEAGIEIPASAFTRLGRSFFPIPGLSTEQIFPLAVELPRDVLELAPEIPHPGDGSAFEEGAYNFVVGLDEALSLVDRPPSHDPHALFINDAKTEIALHRFDRAIRGGQL